MSATPYPLFPSWLLHLLSHNKFPVRQDETDLRPYLKAHGLSGVAALAVETTELGWSASFHRDLLADWRGDQLWAGILDLEAERIGIGAEHAGLAVPILLKGPSVAAHYADPRVRPYSDIDLLIPRASLAGYDSLLRGLGFAPLNDWAFQSEAKFSHHIQYWKGTREQPILCELHHVLTMQREARCLDYEWCESGSARGPLGLLAMAPAHLLLALAVHLTHHSPSEYRAIWFRDFLEIGTNDTLSRSRVLADNLGLGWVLELGLQVVTSVLSGSSSDVTFAERAAHSKGLIAAKVSGAGHRQMRMALMRELGARNALAFLLSRLSRGRSDARRRKSQLFNSLPSKDHL